MFKYKFYNDPYKIIRNQIFMLILIYKINKLKCCYINKRINYFY